MMILLKDIEHYFASAQVIFEIKHHYWKEFRFWGHTGMVS
jgi:hypothetical protein